MVSVVVVMATIAGAFVMGVLTIPEPAPTTTISTEDMNNQEISLIHEGGDTVKTEDLRIIIYNLDGEQENNRIDIDKEEIAEETDKSEWSSGERISIQINEIQVDQGDRVDIRIMHTPSETTIYSELKTT
ncbi:Pilin/Flagellin PilA family [Methanonatronarchaeum thermophilum]|uniref:Pilin/Flagellin PilA family n=2 Tax=Methanonatronarchaeum thermophilum TaxID=1927129 RepID=A0A1Y3GA82_9EURY|nr:Pilin/Flagellin PilA family [Methanonatronarchaeum thermophilum]